MKYAACFLKEILMIFFAKKLGYLHIGLVQVAVKPLTRKGINASVLMCLRDARFKKFNDSILSMIIAFLYDGPIYFDCYPDICLALDDLNIVKALTLNILISGYDMEKGSKPFALICRIYYRVLGSQLNPCARIKDPTGKTMLIQCSTPNAKIQVPKMIQWQDINLPKEWLLERESPRAKPVLDELNLAHIHQYLDGIFKTSFHDKKPLRINEGRHSFARFESISKRDQDLTDFLQKNFEKPGLKLKGVSSDNSQVSTAFYSTKPEHSSPYSRTANEEEEETKSVSPSASNFQTIETLVFQCQLRVLNAFDKNFEIHMVSLFNEFISAKNRDKRKYYQSIFAQSEKDRVKRKWKEKMNQLQKHILFFDFLENYYVSKNHLNVIKKKSNFGKQDKTVVRSSHPPLETVLVSCKGTEVKASPFKIADDQTLVVSINEQNNFTNECLHVIG